jgi:cytochrome c peroxidase
MMRTLFGPLLVLVLVFSAAVSARPGKNTPNLPRSPYRYANVELPAHLTGPERKLDNTPPDNPVTDDGATLGRVLFYDTRLSRNNTTSCASCHVQAHAFADPKPFSKGFHGVLTDRRAMPLVNIRYYQRGRFFWDERVANLEEMVLLPIESRIEMGQNLQRVVHTLARDSMYRALFGRAFGDTQITERRIGKALAQFVRSIVSYQSRYDEGRARARSPQDDFENFTLQENRGKALFMRNCGTCHMKDGNEHFFVLRPANTGLRSTDADADGGVGDATLRSDDLGSFKSPSLRNVEVTGPYGHDGRFATLEAVLDHYSNNPIRDPNLGYAHPAGPLKFTASEKGALIAFLKTLTDRTLLTDPRFSDPFQKRNDLTSGVTRSLRRAGAKLLEIPGTAAQAAASLTALLSPAAPPIPPPPPAEPPHPVIQRLAFFDADRDSRITRRELPERMQGIVGRGDANVDGALDSHEIEALVNAAPAERTQVSVRPHTSEGLPGVIRDLRLSPTKNANALALANSRTAGDLHGQMRALLDAEEYDNFKAAAARLPRFPRPVE